MTQNIIDSRTDSNRGKQALESLKLVNIRRGHTDNKYVVIQMGVDLDTVNMGWQALKVDAESSILAVQATIRKFRSSTYDADTVIAIVYVGRIMIYAARKLKVSYNDAQYQARKSILSMLEYNELGYIVVTAAYHTDPYNEAIEKLVQEKLITGICIDNPSAYYRRYEYRLVAQS